MDNLIRSNPPVPILSHPRAGTEPLNIEERLYTAQEVASRLGVSERWIRDHATRRNPRISAIKLGPLLRFRWTDVQSFVAELAIHNSSKHR